MYLQLGDLAVLIGSMCVVMATFMGIFMPVLMRMINSSEKAMGRRLDSHEEAVSRRFDGQDKQLADVSTRLAGVEKGQGELSEDMKVLSQRFDSQEEAVNRRFDGQDKQLADVSTRLVGVEKGHGKLSSDMAVVKADLSYLKPRVERIDSDLRDIVRPGLERMAGNFSNMADDLGEVKRELKRIAPIEQVGADS